MYLAQVLLDGGHEAEIWDGHVEPLTRPSFVGRLEADPPDVVGVTVLTEFFPSAIQVAAAVKEWNPNVPVVFGGPHVTFRDMDPIQTGLVDVVVRNEGEQALLELVTSLSDGHFSRLDKILGITYREGDGGEGGMRRTPSRPFEKDLDSLPVPDRSLVDLSLYKRQGVMISSRGCPYRCIFCSASAASGHRYRYRSPESVAEEMLFLSRDLGIEHVDIVDDTMTAKPDRTEAVCRILKSSGFDGSWSCSSRIDGVMPDLAGLMSKAGCSRISFGAESGDQEVLDSIDKRLTVEGIISAAHWVHQAEMGVKCSFIVGHHADTDLSIQRTIDFARSLKDECSADTPIGINTPFPGTFLNERAAELGVTILSEEWGDYSFNRCVIRTENLSEYEIQRWYNKALLDVSLHKSKVKGLMEKFLPSWAPFLNCEDEGSESFLLNSLMASSLMSRKRHTPWLSTEEIRETG
jgi:radical SAM superfamily enzyme YgiQ (UPF0313 family)